MYLHRKVLRREERVGERPVALGDADSKGYYPYINDFNLEEFYVVNHGRNALDRWTLARLTEAPMLVDTGQYGIRWQCKVMLYTGNGNARKKALYIPEKRRGTAHGWETVFCQSLAFLAKTLPGRASNKEMTGKHQARLNAILETWDKLSESEQEEEEDEEAEEQIRTNAARKRGREEDLDEEYVYEQEDDSRGSSQASAEEDEEAHDNND